jgi:hypothetical protein
VVSSEYRNKLNRQIADISKNAVRARGVYDRLAPLLNKYHGGMSAGFLAAIASFESGGKMSSRGDSSLGEVGIFQITKTFPQKVGLPASSRFDEATNVFLGCIEYQIMAVEMYFAAPAIGLGGVDNWKLARLAFSIGAGGTRTLLKKSGARSWSELVDYVDRVGGLALGRQTAGKVWFRVRVIDVLWAVGQEAKPVFWSGAPVKIPNPPSGSYTLPASVAPFLPSPLRGPLISLAVGGAAILLA